MKVSIAVSVSMLLLASNAIAGTSEQYACEAKQSALAKKLAKSECVDFAKEAAKLDCKTTDGAAKVMDFGKKCREVDEAKLDASQAKYDASKAKMADSKAAAAAATPKPGALAKDTCQAELDDGTVLASGTAEKYSDCSKQMEAAVKTAKCTGDTKKFAWKFRRGDMAPSTRTVYCK